MFSGGSRFRRGGAIRFFFSAPPHISPDYLCRIIPMCNKKAAAM
jgi:hypothetical protein